MTRRTSEAPFEAIEINAFLTARVGNQSRPMMSRGLATLRAQPLPEPFDEQFVDLGADLEPQEHEPHSASENDA